VTMASLERLVWPASGSAQALSGLALATRLDVRQADLPSAPPELATCGPDELHTWLVASAEWLGLEVERLGAMYVDFGSLLLNTGPALLKLPGEQNRLLALVGRRGRRLRLLAPDRTIHTRTLEEVRAALCEDLETRVATPVGAVLERMDVPPREREQARKHLLQEMLRTARVERCWLIRSPPTTPLMRQARQAGLGGLILMLLGTYAAQGALGVAAWWTLSQLLARDDGASGWLVAWALVLVTLVPFRLLSIWCSGRLTLAAGGLIRRHLLMGALAMDPEEIRHRGIGQLMGTTFESENLETSTLSGVLLCSSALLDLCVAAALLAAGSGGWPHVALLLAVLGAVALLGVRAYRTRTRWTQERLSLTHDLLERMLGHRTRLVQERRERWHEGEDQKLARYLAAGAEQERQETLLSALVPQAWLCIGMLGLVGPIVSGATPGALAAGLGGLLIAHPALKRLAQGVLDLSAAASSWRELRHILAATQRTEPPGSPVHLMPAQTAEPEESSPGTLLEASQLVYHYPRRGEPALKEVSLQVRAGDHVLLEGLSGGGKSTLASLLAGLRTQGSGLLLVDGMDRRTLGVRGWRNRIVSAPQFHENHVFTGTLAYNLLMGRDWPCHPEDLREAEEICREIGLGELLDRMPGGLHQMVGETGWQLSHGERSRLFIARALLQRAKLTILDESFAALDPETLDVVMACVQRHARSLVVVAHP
jgi:ATP-binding cassette subfamily B protein